MHKPLVIFGCEDAAELAYFYFQNDSSYEVVGFSVDAEFIQTETFSGKPLVPYEDVVSHYPPEKYSFFIALGYSKLNSIRKEKYLSAKEKGYQIASYVSSRATVLNEGHIGENCFLLENNTIQPFVKIGSNVTLWSGNHIGHHSKIGDHTFVASHVVVSGRVEIGEQCFIGVNATIRDHLKIGDKCVIGAGALLLADAEAGGVYLGPATERSKVPSHRLRGI